MPAIIAAMKNDILDIPNTFYFPTWKAALSFYKKYGANLIVVRNAILPEDLEW
jgi:hypothetical protein